MATALAIGIGYLVSVLLAGPVSLMLAQGLSAKNYRGELIPTSMGIVLLVSVLGSLGSLAMGGWIDGGQFSIYSFWLTLVCLACSNKPFLPPRRAPVNAPSL